MWIYSKSNWVNHTKAHNWSLHTVRFQTVSVEKVHAAPSGRLCRSWCPKSLVQLKNTLSLNTQHTQWRCTGWQQVWVVLSLREWVCLFSYTHLILDVIILFVIKELINKWSIIIIRKLIPWLFFSLPISHEIHLARLHKKAVSSCAVWRSFCSNALHLNLVPEEWKQLNSNNCRRVICGSGEAAPGRTLL